MTADILFLTILLFQVSQKLTVSFSISISCRSLEKNTYPPAYDRLGWHFYMQLVLFSFARISPHYLGIKNISTIHVQLLKLPLNLWMHHSTKSYKSYLSLVVQTGLHHMIGHALIILLYIPSCCCMSHLHPISHLIISLSKTISYWKMYMVCYGVERDWNDLWFLSGRKWVPRLRFYTSFTPAFYRLITATYRSDVAKWWTRDRRDFYFLSRYFRFRPGGKPRAFSADSYLGRTLPGLRAYGIGLGRATTSGRAISASDGSKGAAPGADTTIDYTSGCNKTRFFHVESADFNGKYTKLHWELEITPSLITNQSTIINCDFASRIRQFCDFPTRKWKY